MIRLLQGDITTLDVDCIVNAANEHVVDQFLKGKIPFLGISKIIMSVLKDRNFKKNAVIRPLKLNQIIEIDKWSQKVAQSRIKENYV